MRGLPLWIAALFALLICTGCSAPANESSVQPSGTDVQTAKDFLATKSKPEDGKVGDATWAVGIALHTHYESSAMSGQSWSMTLQKPDGATAVFQSALMSLPDKLNEIVSAGDYVAYKDDGSGYLSDTEVRVITKAAVVIKGN